MKTHQIAQILIAVLAVTLLGACTTTGSYPTQGRSSDQMGNTLAVIGETLMPRTTRNLQRLGDRLAGAAPRVDYQTQQRIEAEERARREWELSRRYPQNPYERYSRSQTEQREYEEYQEYLAWKESQSRQSRPLTKSTRTPSYQQQEDLRRLENETLSHEEFAVIARRNGASQQQIDDHRATQTSLEKLPWESEREYRDRLQNLLEENKARQARYSASTYGR